MFFLSFFESLGSLLCGMASLFFLLFAIWRASEIKYAKGLKELWFAFFVFFLTAFFYAKYAFFVANGVSYSVLTFLRLFLTVGATVLLLRASSKILLSKDLPIHVLFLFISLGLFASLYANLKYHSSIYPGTECSAGLFPPDVQNAVCAVHPLSSGSFFVGKQGRNNASSKKHYQ